jgi:solute carrier family 35, member E3
MWVVSSGVSAGVLNISGFFVIGIFSAVTYSVSGHAKTLLVLLMGFWIFGDPLTLKGAWGIFIAAFGLAGYGYFT